MNAYDSDPMDAGLLQLERELFSLTPSAPHRELSAQIESSIFAPAAATAPVPEVARRSGFLLSPVLKKAAVPAAAAAAAVLGVFAQRGFVAQNQTPGQATTAPAPDQLAPQHARRPVLAPSISQRQFVVFQGRPGLYEVTPDGLVLVHASFADALEGASPTVPDRFDPRWLDTRPIPAAASEPAYRLTPASLQ